MHDTKVEKYIGIVRKVDRMSRLVIPKEYCRLFEIAPKTPLEILAGIIDGEKVLIIKKAYKTTKKSQ